VYPEFVEEISDALRRVKTDEFTTLLSDFNAHIGNDTTVRKGLIGRYDNADVNVNGRLILQMCCNNAMCIINTFFQRRDLHKYTPGAEVL